MSPTVVFPVPPVPVIEVISPYLKPPPRVVSSIPGQPELAGGGIFFLCAFAVVYRVEPKSPGAASWAAGIACCESLLGDWAVACHHKTMITFSGSCSWKDDVAMMEAIYQALVK